MEEKTKIIVEVPKKLKKRWLKVLTDVEMTQRDFIIESITNFLERLENEQD